MKNKKVFISVLVSSLILAGCATSDYNTRPYSYDSNTNYENNNNAYNNQHVHYGVVENIRFVQGNRSGIGAGAVAGAVVGGLIGSQIGGGSGRTAATIGGVIAGGAVGNHIEDSNKAYVQVIDVRLNGGNILSIAQKDGARFYKGQQVKVIGSGSSARVVSSDSYEYRRGY